MAIYLDGDARARESSARISLSSIVWRRLRATPVHPRAALASLLFLANLIDLCICHIQC